MNCHRLSHIEHNMAVLRRNKPLLFKIVVLVSVSIVTLRYAMYHYLPQYPNKDLDDGSSVEHGEKENCMEPRLNPLQAPSSSSSCVRVKPMKGSCDLAAKLFLSSPPGDCSHQKRNDICEIRMTSQLKASVHCSPDICNGDISLGITNSSTGLLCWQHAKNPSELENTLSVIIEDHSRQHFGFCFIRCRPIRHSFPHQWWEGEAEINQLLTLPPQLPPLKSKSVRQNFININVIFIDSISHSHFYRSLPNTVNTFREINNGQHFGATVLDFELFQAIKSRTFESLQALFAGEVDLKEMPFGTYDIPSKALSLEELFIPFKNNGYSTLWVEDLCWAWEWGIVKDLRVHKKSMNLQRKWNKFQKALNTAGIDNIDITLANCQILKANGVNDHFHGPDTVCYNGRHQHEYLLEYLDLYQRQATGRPYFSFVLTDVSHEDTGRRVQTLDKHLADYMRSLSHQDNTLTVVLSDHGNTYGRFMTRSLEGRIEMFHPVLFMIVPDKVASLLGPQKVENLKMNQNKLISLVDLHYTLRSIISTESCTLMNKFHVNCDGLFSPVPANRTCDDIPRLQPNLCICDGFEEVAQNDSQHALIAEFALGKLNNLLLNQYRSANPRSSMLHGACRRLVPHRFGNIREKRESDDSVLTKLDIFIPVISDNDELIEEIFFVIVKSVLGTRTAMELLSFDRVTAYSQYEKCCDAGVNVVLCICTEKTKVGRSLDLILHSLPPVLQRNSELRKLKTSHGSCLFIISREYETGVCFECANMCSVTYSIEFIFTCENMDLSAAMPLQETMEPHDMKFLLVARQSVEHLGWNWQYDIKLKAV